MITMSIPALVKSLRERMRLTQEQFAHEVGSTFSTVNQWKNGRRRPPPFLLKRPWKWRLPGPKAQSAGPAAKGTS